MFLDELTRQGFMFNAKSHVVWLAELHLPCLNLCLNLNLRFMVTFQGKNYLVAKLCEILGGLIAIVFNPI